MSPSGLPLVTLVILDGWGIAPPGPGNAVELARTPVFDDLVARYPTTQLVASGAAVGLPDGQMGNSEVGHLTIGSGRILYQDLVRVTRAVEDGSLFENDALVGAFRRARERDGAGASARPRLAGRRPLAHRPPAGAARARPARGDGRPDVDPRLHRRARRLARGIGRPISRRCRPTASRRSSAATTRWTATSAGSGPTGRSRRSVDGVGERADDPVDAVRASYARGVTDEFVEPVVLEGRPRLDPARDTAIVFNFRPDRVRQLTERLLDAGVDVVTMTRYRDDFDCPVAFDGAAGGRHARRGPRAAGRAPAPRRRDGEVRARHVLLQRRDRGAVAGGGRGSSCRRRATSRATT